MRALDWLGAGSALRQYGAASGAAEHGEGIAEHLLRRAALAAGRYQRIRESALLRVLGARRRQVRGMLLTEYVALGLLAGFVGVLLGATSGWLLVRFVFKLDFTLPALSLGVLWVGIATMSAIMGLYTSRDALAGTPLEVIRENAG